MVEPAPDRLGEQLRSLGEAVRHQVHQVRPPHVQAIRRRIVRRARRQLGGAAATVLALVLVAVVGLQAAPWSLIATAKDGLERLTRPPVPEAPLPAAPETTPSTSSAPSKPTPTTEATTVRPTAPPETTQTTQATQTTQPAAAAPATVRVKVFFHRSWQLNPDNKNCTTGPETAWRQVENERVERRALRLLLRGPKPRELNDDGRRFYSPFSEATADLDFNFRPEGDVVHVNFRNLDGVKLLPRGHPCRASRVLDELEPTILQTSRFKQARFAIGGDEKAFYVKLLETGVPPR
jgi:hypothetical protein